MMFILPTSRLTISSKIIFMRGKAIVQKSSYDLYEEFINTSIYREQITSCIIIKCKTNMNLRGYFIF